MSLVRPGTLAWSLAVVVFAVGCESVRQTSNDLGAADVDGGAMQRSNEAGGIIERAQRIHPVPVDDDIVKRHKQHRRVSALATLLPASDVEARVVGDTIHATSSMTRPISLDVTYPTEARQDRTFKLTSGTTIASLTLRDAADATAEWAQGYLVYRGATRSGAHVIVRPSEDGAEDYFLFETKPERRRVEYELSLSPSVAGLRLSSNILEFVDSEGTPIMHVAAPILVDSAGKSTNAQISVPNCAVDESTQPTWNRKPTPPGNTRCRVAISWNDDGVRYPALLDPTWASGHAMPITSAFWNAVALVGRKPQQLVVFGFLDSTGAKQTTLFYDVDTGTWSAGPPTVLARTGGSAVSFNNAHTNNGAQVLVTGGYTATATTWQLEGSTERLAMDASGHWAWTTSAPLHAPREGHTATVLPTATGAQVLLVGGYGLGPYANGCDPGATASTAELYDTATGTFVNPAPPNLPTPVFEHAAELSPDEQAVIVMGGYNGRVDSPVDLCSGSQAVYAYRGGQWLTLPSMPTYRLGPEVTALNDGRMIVTSGSGYADSTQQTCVNISTTQIFTYSATAPYGSWTTADPGPANSQGMALPLWNGGMLYGPLATFVDCGPPPNPTNQVQLFDPASGHWTPTTSTAVPHYGGVSMAVQKTTGENEAVLFGGATAFNATSSTWTYTNATEILSLDPAGTACTNGATCASGQCVGGVCQGAFRVKIDATALTPSLLKINGATPVFDAHHVQTFQVPSGSYTILVGTTLTSAVTFSIDSKGKVRIPSSFAAFAKGNGSDTLKLVGAQITITPHMSNTALALAGLFDVPPVAIGATSTLRLLPLTGGVYQFTVDNTSLSTLGFNLDLNGKLTYDATFDHYVTGRGTTALSINAPTITIDATPDGPGQFQIGGIGTYDRSSLQTVQLLPVVGGYQYSDTDGTEVFLVRDDGTVDYDPSLDNQFSGRGTSTLTDSPSYCFGMTPGQNIPLAEGSGWLLPGQFCPAPGTTQTMSLSPAPYHNSARVKTTGSAPSIAPTALATGSAGAGKTGRAPGIAGGDPVLADGEFFIQRTDARLAGTGIHYEFTRTYRSGVNVFGPLGDSWDHNYNKQLIVDPAYSDSQAFPNCYRNPMMQSVDYSDGALNVVHFKRTSGQCMSPTTYPCVDIFTSAATTGLSLEHHLPSSDYKTEFWKMTDADDNVLLFDFWGHLTSITDPAGNALTMTWYQDPLYVMLWRLQSVTDSAKRTVSYIYDNPAVGKGKIQCITVDSSCGGANQLAQFNYSGTATHPYLASVYRGRATSGEQYQYASGAIPSYPPADPQHRFSGHFPCATATWQTPSCPSGYQCTNGFCEDWVNVAPGDCLPNGAIDFACHRLCGTYTGDPDSCYNANKDSVARTDCTDVNCQIVNPTYTPPDDIVLSCTAAQTKTGTVSSLCLQGLDEVPWSNMFPNGVAITSPNTTNDCLTACQERFQCWGYFGDTAPAPVWRPFYAAGTWFDLQNNITDVLDDGGNLVVHNEYGTNLNHVDYDRVIMQTLGPDTDPANSIASNQIHFTYHDLDIEANGLEIYSLRNFNYNADGTPNPHPQTGDPHHYNWGQGDSSIWFGAPSIRDASVGDAPYWDLCPAAGTAGNAPAYKTYAAAQLNLFGPTAKTAVVVTDNHYNIRTQYYDQSLNLLREELKNASVTSNIEVSTYNYDSSNRLVAVSDPAGARTCYELDSFGHPTQVTKIPAAGYSGDTTPLVDVYAYDGQRQLVDVYRDVAHGAAAMVHAHLKRDPKTELVVERDDSGASITTPLVTTYSYADCPGDTPVGVREIPSTITLPDRTTVNTYCKVDPSLGGVQQITLNAGADASQQQQFKATYDNLGRLTYYAEVGPGNVDRYGQQYVYDAVTTKLLEVNHRYDQSSPWMYRQVTSHWSDGESKTDSLVDVGRRGALFLYDGTLFPTTKIYAPAGSQAPGEAPLPAQQVSCYHYTADGRLYDVILPENNEVHYRYDPAGRLTSVSKGPATGFGQPWATRCPTKAPPAGDPGEAVVRSWSYTAGGFLAGFSSDDQWRDVVTDGFGRVIQTSGAAHPGNGQPASAGIVAVSQRGYDGTGRVIWEASLAPGAGMPTNSYQKPTAQTSGLLEMTEYAYDLFDRVTLVTAWDIQRQEPVVTSSTYDDVKRTVTITKKTVPWSGSPTDPGRTIVRTFDGLGRIRHEVLPDTSTTDTTYAYVNGVFTATVVQQTNQPTALTRVYQYDTRGNMTAVLDGQNNKLSSSSYDDDGNLVLSSAAGKGDLTLQYDRFGRLVHKQQDLLSTPPGAVTTADYGWDGDDRRTSVTDGEKNQWTTVYSTLDQPLTVSGPSTYLKTIVYAPGFASHPGGIVESNGRKSCYRYDEDMRPSYVYSDGCPKGQSLIGPVPAALMLPEREYTTHTPLGLAATVTALADDSRPATATVTFAYDSLRRVTDEIVNSGSADIPSYTVHHDFLDTTHAEQTSITLSGVGAPLPVWYRHQYDALGRLSSVVLNDKQIAGYDYGAAGIGGPKSLTYSNGALSTFSYDAKLRQTGIDVKLQATGGSAFIASLHEAFGADGVPRIRQRTIGGGAAMTDVFQVDGDGRLSAENLVLPNITVPAQEVDNSYPAVANNIATGQAWRQYSLDNIGNWKSVTNASGTLSYPVDGQSRLTAVGSQTMSIDATDNLLGVAGDSANFAFEPFTGALVTGKNTQTGASATYAYDALGRRALEKYSDGSTSAVLWDGQKIVGHGNATNPIVDVPADDVDGHIASVEQTGTGSARFYHQGPDQSVLAISDNQGLVEGYSYSAFGEQTTWAPNGATLPATSIGNRFGFQGQLYDALTGTYSMRARQYRPSWGRFLSPDPLSFHAAPSLYSFAGSRPLSGRDPLGLCEVDDGYSDCGIDWLPPPTYNPQPLPPQQPSPGGGSGGGGSGGVPIRYPQPPVSYNPWDGRIGHAVGGGLSHGTPGNAGPTAPKPTPVSVNDASAMPVAVVAGLIKAPMMLLAMAGPGNDAKLNDQISGVLGYRVQGPIAAMADVWASFYNGIALDAIGAALPAGEAAGVVLEELGSVADAAEATPRTTSLWSPKEVNGIKVYQRPDLIDPDLIDALGRSNLQRMQKGLAPIGPDGEPINLHHMLQTDDGPIAELTQTFHQENYRAIHINDNSIPSGIDRRAFDAWRRAYWQTRALDFGVDLRP